MKNAKEGTDGPVYNAGRRMGRADICAELRDILDPDDKHHWNLDGVLKEVTRLARVNKAMVDKINEILNSGMVHTAARSVLLQVLSAGEAEKEK